MTTWMARLNKPLCSVHSRNHLRYAAGIHDLSLAQLHLLPIVHSIVDAKEQVGRQCRREANDRVELHSTAA